MTVLSVSSSPRPPLILSLSDLLCSSKQHLTTFPAFDLLFTNLEAETSLFSYSFLFWVLQHLLQWERLLLLGSNSDGFHRRDLSLMEMVDWMCFTSEGVGTTAAVRGLPTPLHPEKATPSSLSISLLLINSLLLIHFLTPYQLLVVIRYPHLLAPGLALHPWYL